MSKGTHRYAGILLISNKSEVIAQLRDNKPDIDNPGKVSVFGGSIEKGEAPIEAAVRELTEETNIKVTPEDLEVFTNYFSWRELTREQEEMYIFVLKGVETSGLEIYEGQRYYIVSDFNDPLITKNCKPAFDKWFRENK